VPAHYVLDHNFPLYVAGFAWPRSIEVSRLAEIDPTLIRGHEDWEVLIALSGRGDVDGFITNDSRMLNLPREMIALSRTRLALVIADGVGHDALRATGLVMVHLEQVARNTDGQPRIFVLRPSNVQPAVPWERINSIARHHSVNVNSLVADELAAMGLPRREPEDP